MSGVIITEREALRRDGANLVPLRETRARENSVGAAVLKVGRLLLELDDLKLKKKSKALCENY